MKEYSVFDNYNIYFYSIDNDDLEDTSAEDEVKLVMKQIEYLISKMDFQHIIPVIINEPDYSIPLGNKYQPK